MRVKKQCLDRLQGDFDRVVTRLSFLFERDDLDAFEYELGLYVKLRNRWVKEVMDLPELVDRADGLDVIVKRDASVSALVQGAIAGLGVTRGRLRKARKEGRALLTGDSVEAGRRLECSV